MNNLSNLIIGLSALFITGIAQAELPKSTDMRIAFGSCAYDYEDQPLWFDIAAVNPDFFLFIGDNQYADVQFDKMGNRKMGPVTDPSAFEKAYGRLGAKPGFKKLRETVPVYATWDDHDYGANDAGKEYPLKVQSQQAFIDFFGFDAEHPIHQQEGVYQSYMKSAGDLKVQVILLDTRYHRDPLTKNPQGRPENKGGYIPNTDTSTSLLGSTQWQWLEEELKKQADIRFVISSIQVVAYEHGWESWGNMPHERQRLYDLITKTKASGVVFLSGDRHLMEMSKDEGKFGYSVPYTMYDFTSSGMTQAFREVNEANTYRIGEPVRDTHYGVVDIILAKDTMDTEIVMTALGKENKIFQQERIKLKALQFSQE